MRIRSHMGAEGLDLDHTPILLSRADLAWPDRLAKPKHTELRARQMKLGRSA